MEYKVRFVPEVMASIQFKPNLPVRGFRKLYYPWKLFLLVNDILLWPLNSVLEYLQYPATYGMGEVVGFFSVGGLHIHRHTLNMSVPIQTACLEERIHTSLGGHNANHPVPDYTPWIYIMTLWRVYRGVIVVIWDSENVASLPSCTAWTLTMSEKSSLTWPKKKTQIRFPIFWPTTHDWTYTPLFGCLDILTEWNVKVDSLS